jgi:hypothetical protein
MRCMMDAEETVKVDDHDDIISQYSMQKNEWFLVSFFLAWLES